MRKTIHLFPIFFLFVSSLPILQAYGQEQLLRIISPSTGSPAFAGKALTVTVAADPSVRSYIVIGGNPLPSPQPTSRPNEFVLAIPATIASGVYSLTAMGVASNNEMLASEPVEIKIERDDDPYGLTLEPFFMALDRGHQQQIRVLGDFERDLRVDVTNSSRIEFFAVNPKVASVNNKGVITGVSPGRAVIQVAYPNKQQGKIYTALVVEVSEPPPSGPAPAISRIAPESGIPGETQVTIEGTGFGATPGSGYVTIGTQSASAISSWTDTRIVATVPEYSWTGMVLVTQNDRHSNNFPFKILSPVIRGISPIRLVPGITMTIRGEEFGSAEKGFVTFDDVRAEVVSWNETGIIVIVPNNLTRGHIYVHQGRYTSNFVNFRIMPAEVPNK